MPRSDGLGVETFVLVGQLVAVVIVDVVGKAVAELQLGNKLEEGQIEITAQAYLDHGTIAFQLHIVLFLAREIEHGTDTSQDVRSVVVEALGTELQVDRKGDVGVLQVLRGELGLSVVIEVIEIAEREVLGTKVHRG